jgi:hypothetical protein
VSFDTRRNRTRAGNFSLSPLNFQKKATECKIEEQLILC